MVRWVVLMGCALTTVLLAGCGSSGRSPAAVVEADRFVTAPFAAASSMRIDGVLDEPVWRDVKPVALSRAADATARSAPEQAIAKLVWTESHVIVGVTCTDADVIAESDADQEFHYKFGDVVEVFLKPERQSWYWELYGTPKGKRTRFFYPGRGHRALPSTLSGPGELRVGAKVDGTLNAWRDTDRGWTVELAVPRSDLESIGDVVGPDTEWRLLVGRYNYGKSIESVELTGWPKQPKTDFHGYEHYGVVRFQQPATR